MACGHGPRVGLSSGVDRRRLRILRLINSLGATLLEKPGHEIRFRITAVAAKLGDAVFGAMNEFSGHTVLVPDPGR